MTDKGKRQADAAFRQKVMQDAQQVIRGLSMPDAGLWYDGNFNEDVYTGWPTGRGAPEDIETAIMGANIVVSQLGLGEVDSSGNLILYDDVDLGSGLSGFSLPPGPEFQQVAAFDPSDLEPPAPQAPVVINPEAPEAPFPDVEPGAPPEPPPEPPPPPRGQRQPGFPEPGEPQNRAEALARQRAAMQAGRAGFFSPSPLQTRGPERFGQGLPTYSEFVGPRGTTTFQQPDADQQKEGETLQKSEQAVSYFMEQLTELIERITVILGEHAQRLESAADRLDQAEDYEDGC